MPGVGLQRAGVRLRKAAADNAYAFQLIAHDGANFAQWEVPASGYQLSAGAWYRITASWNLGNGLAQARLFIDGVELMPSMPTALLVMPQANPAEHIYFGAFNFLMDPPWTANGIFDEVVIYDTPIVP